MKNKILIIEDEEPIADLLAYGLAMEGFETRTAASGAAGFRSLRHFIPICSFWIGSADQSGLDMQK